MQSSKGTNSNIMVMTHTPQIETNESKIELPKNAENISDDVFSSGLLQKETHYIHSLRELEGKYEKFSVYLEPNTKEVYAVVRLGENMCGHTGIVHGGCIATLIDEISGWTFYANGHGAGFTANLNVNFRRPLPSNKTILVKCSIAEVSGRKVYIDCVLEDGENNLFSEGKALFIIPRKENKSSNQENDKSNDNSSS